jgi:hypothetical protein
MISVGHSEHRGSSRDPWHHQPREGDSVILEAAVLQVRLGQSSDFEAAFAKA